MRSIFCAMLAKFKVLHNNDLLQEIKQQNAIDCFEVISLIKAIGNLEIDADVASTKED